MDLTDGFGRSEQTQDPHQRLVIHGDLPELSDFAKDSPVLMPIM